MAKHAVSDSEESEVGKSSPVTKRARMSSSLPLSSPPALPSDGDEDDEDVLTLGAGERAKERAINGIPAQRQQDEESSDDDEDDSMDEDEDEEASKRETALLEQMKARGNGSGTIAQKGIIERVELQNFMCHKFTTVDFGPQINFLVGNNGSGKSAILTGITMALGGNAKATNRATKGSGLVMEGMTWAKCSVRLRNRGPEAYQPNVYGESITVERTIRVNGGGSYKILNHEGAVVETSRATLDAILDQFNIQVENPMTVLTQDQSRQFLASASAQQKYNFFLRGTQLAQLTEEYEAISTNTHTMQAVVDKKREIIPDLKEAYKRAKDRAKDAEAAVGQQDKLETLKNRIAWCEVDECEVKIAKGEAWLAKEQEVVPKIVEKLQDFEEKKNEASVVIQDCEEAQKETQLDKEEKEPLLKELKAKVQAAREKTKEWNHTERTVSATIQRQKDQISDYEVQIAQEKKRLERDVEAELRPIRERIKQLEDENLSNSKVNAEAGQEIDQLEERRAQLAGELDEAKQKLRMANEDAQKIQNQIRQVEASKNNAMLAFGPSIPALLKAIDAETGWRQKPLGPLARYAELSDRRWSTVLEAIGGITLNSFVVSNEQDRAKLFRLYKLHKIDHNVPIIRLAYDDQFDCSGAEPDRDLLTILRVLRFSNKHVEQAFINSVSPENAVLVRERPEGDRVFDDQRHNVRMVYSADMFEISRRDGKAATKAIDRWRGAARLNPDVAGQVRSLQEDLSRIRGHIAEFESEKSGIDAQLLKVHRDRQNADRRIKEARAAVTRHNREIEKLQQSLQEQEPSNIGVIEDLRDACKAELESTLAQYNEALRIHEESGVDVAPIVEEKNKIEDEIKKADKLQKAVMTKLNQAIEERVNADSAIAQYNKKLSDQEEKINRIRESVDDEREMLAQLVEQAEQICTRPEGVAKQSEARLRKQIESLQKALRDRERTQGATIEEVLTELANRKRVLTEAKETVNSLVALCNALMAAYQTRISRWTDFRDQISTRARMQFLHHLSARGFTGRLQFDHDRLRLNLRVQTEEGEKRQRNKQKDAKSLSGGEKSFSTICLLLTMWEAVGCPIRCLDEFDVFMDAVNRRISMKMMVDTAKAADEVQFILITPQSMSGSKYGPEVRITKLGDPFRSQGRLAFGMG